MTLAVGEKRIFEANGGGWGATINTVFEVRGGEVCVDPIKKQKTANVAAITETHPTKLCIELGSVSPLPAPKRSNKAEKVY